MSEKVVLTPEDIRRTLARIAHEIIERSKSTEDIVLIGLHTRGVPLARRLSANVEAIEGTKIPVGSLDFSLYRDDLSSRSFTPVVKNTDIPVSIDDKTVILVDDVLFTGRSIRAAMDAHKARLYRKKHTQLIKREYTGKTHGNGRHRRSNHCH